MSNKHNLVLYIDKDLVEKMRNLGFNLSKTFENHLKQLLKQFSTVNSMNNAENNSIQNVWWAGPDLNRRPSARQADVLTETGHSGLWNTPYVLDSNNKDNYPIVPEFSSFLIMLVSLIAMLLAAATVWSPKRRFSRAR